MTLTLVSSKAAVTDGGVLTAAGLGSAISTVAADRIRPIELKDFVEAARRARPSVNRQQLSVFEQWTRDFGTNVSL